MSKPRTLEAMQAQIKEMRARLVTEKNQQEWYKLVDEINSLSVDIDQAKKQEKGKGIHTYIPDQIVIINQK